MTSIEDPLSKPIWPTVDSSLQETVLSLLIPLYSRGTSATVKIGFNNAMRALEQHVAGESQVVALFVARSDLNPAECMPLAMASAATQAILVALPRGSREKLGGEGVIAFLVGTDEPQILNLIKNIGPAKYEWVYKAAQVVKPNKKPNLQKKENRAKKGIEKKEVKKD